MFSIFADVMLDHYNLGRWDAPHHFRDRHHPNSTNERERDAAERRRAMQRTGLR